MRKGHLNQVTEGRDILDPERGHITYAQGTPQSLWHQPLCAHGKPFCIVTPVAPDCLRGSDCFRAVSPAAAVKSACARGVCCELIHSLTSWPLAPARGLLGSKGTRVIKTQSQPGREAHADPETVFTGVCPRCHPIKYPLNSPQRAQAQASSAPQKQREDQGFPTASGPSLQVGATNGPQKKWADTACPGTSRPVGLLVVREPGLVSRTSRVSKKSTSVWEGVRRATMHSDSAA